MRTCTRPRTTGATAWSPETCCGPRQIFSHETAADRAPMLWYLPRQGSESYPTNSNPANPTATGSESYPTNPTISRTDSGHLGHFTHASGDRHHHDRVGRLDQFGKARLQVQKGLPAPGIELGSGSPLQFAKGLVQRKAAPVGSTTGHGVKG